jgi:D-glycero-D-manno-heptose 1,7-bisphosphate phosphatase
MEKAKAVFLDRDGVLDRALVREGKPYPPQSLDQFELLPGVVDACALLKSAGFLLVVVTNQPDVGRGTIARHVVDAIHQRMSALLPIDRVEVSMASGNEEPPDEFRKPRPGMLLRASRELDIDLKRSFMVGDRWRDIDAGNAAGCQTIFVDHGYQEELRTSPDFRVKDLLHAAEVILSCDRHVLISAT